MTGRELTQRRVATLHKQVVEMQDRIEESVESHRVRITAKYAGKLAARNAELAVLEEALAESEPVQ